MRWNCVILWKTMSRTSEGWRASLGSLLLFSLDSTGHCKTVLNNDGFCQLFNTSPPPFPLCHYVIISSTPSLPLSSPFTEQAHNKTHSVTLCIFTPSLLALDETASPLSPARSPRRIFWRGVASDLFSDWPIYHVVKRRQRRGTLKVSGRWHWRERLLRPGCCLPRVPTVGARHLWVNNFRFQHHLPCWPEGKKNSWMIEAAYISEFFVWFVLKEDGIKSLYLSGLTGRYCFALNAW